MLSPAERRAKIKAIIRVAAGNFIEAYDFVIYGYYAQYIGATFFPAGSEFASLMLAFVTFGAAYLIRPLGAIVLGSYIDKHGRKKGLILTLSLMAIGTLSIAVTPGYAEIGLLAPLIVVAGRLIQGLSAGAEFGGVTIYLLEIATPGRRGFYCSWQPVSQQLAVVFSAAIGLALTAFVPPEQMTLWGWRIPLLIGTAAIPVVLWLRTSLEETDAFKQSHHVTHLPEVLRILAANWALILTGTGMSVLMTTSFYLITTYTPAFARQVLGLVPTEVFQATLFAGVFNVLWLPAGGMLTDKYGARPLMLAVAAAAVVCAYPAMLFLVAGPSFGKLLAVLLLYSMFFGLYAGGLIPLLAEIMPREVRTTGFSFAFVIATAIFGGFTPAIVTFLIEATGNRAASGLWLSLAAAISLAAAAVLPVVQSAGARTRNASAATG
jgi:MHS family citrate/tricarballylate:H+ symporter-like MFS transporter